MHRSRLLLSLVVTTLLAISFPWTAAAQSTATVIANAPIYVTNTPSANLGPLRVAAVGTVLKVVGEQGDWLQVQFQDPQWGLRSGWVQKAHVKVSDPSLRPMDLSIRESRAGIGTQREGVGVPRGDTPQGTAPASSPRELTQTRDGFWFNVGMGFGSLGCEDCSARENGLSGGLSLGGAINDRLLLGVGTTGWAKEIEDEIFTVGTLDARLRFYPVRSSGFFLTGGLGVGSISYAGESEIGLGAILGLGWDIRVGRNVSLTPFWNGFAMRNSTADGNVGQIGLGVTIH